MMYPMPKEQEPTTNHNNIAPDEAAQSTEGWPTTAMAIALTTVPDPVFDPAFEWGTQLTVGPLESPTRLEVYEQRDAVRITSRNVRIELHRPTEIVVFHDNVVFSAGKRDEGTYLHARVDRDGNAALLLDQPSAIQPMEVVNAPPAVPSQTPQERAQSFAGSRESRPAKEKQPTVTVTGKLQTTPRQGNPDAKGNPTAWALVAVHIEGDESPHLYSATFHRQTARTALVLPKDAQVTIKGFAHAKQEGQPNDTFSVIAIVDYPGKPPKQR